MSVEARMKLVRFSGRFMSRDSCSFLVVALEVHGRVVAQPLVATVRVAPSFDELEDRPLCLAMIMEPGAVEQLALQSLLRKLSWKGPCERE